jgi:hypothetical protein
VTRLSLPLEHCDAQSEYYKENSKCCKCQDTANLTKCEC